jgi:hypothetical protein
VTIASPSPRMRKGAPPTGFVFSYETNCANRSLRTSKRLVAGITDPLGNVLHQQASVVVSGLLLQSGLLLIVDSKLRQSSAVFLEIADLHERGPQFNRALDHADYIIDDSHQVLLKKVWLEPIECLL